MFYQCASLYEIESVFFTIHPDSNISESVLFSLLYAHTSIEQIDEAPPHVAQKEDERS